MSTRNKYLVLAGVLLAIVVVAIVFIVSWGSSHGRQTQNSGIDTSTEYNPSGEISQNIDNPEVTDNSTISGSNAVNGEQAVSPTVDNTDLANTLETPEEMQQVIEQNTEDLNNEEVVNQLAQSYPRDLIPVYKAISASDSADIITDNGNPGWTAQYGSDAPVNEITSFYEDLMKGSSGYSSQKSGNSNVIIGTVDNCNVKITVSPNNADRTGLDNESNVDIFIERN